MRSHGKPIQLLFLLSVLVGFTGCAASGGGQADPAEPAGEGIAVQIRNDITPPTGVVIWVVNDMGRRTRLGPVPSNGRRTFTFDPPSESQLVQLVAVPEGPRTGTMAQASERTSNQFSTIGVEAVSWSVSRRNVQIGG
jgi:hypothetical protein